MKIYVVLSHTYSMPSIILQSYLKKEYTHCSLSFDDSFTNMYSFGRKYLYTPFLGAFVKECINDGLYIKNNAQIIILEKEVTPQQYEYLKAEIQEMYENKEKYKYNWLGILMYLVNKDRKLSTRFTCSQFVGYALQNADIIDYDNVYHIIPTDFLNLNFTVNYKGTIEEYIHAK